MNYEEIIEIVIDEITELALAKYRKEDVEINELLKEQQGMYLKNWMKHFVVMKIVT